MDLQKRLDEVIELLANAHEEDGSQGEIEELENELDLLSMKIEAKNDVARNATFDDIMSAGDIWEGLIH